MTDKDLPLGWVAAPGEEIEVLTQELCDHFGGCAHCPGISSTAELGIEDDETRTVFCTHWCHQKSPEV